MGIFHKTLKDAEARINKNDFSGALTILTKHQMEDLNTEKLLISFKRDIEDYDALIKIVIYFLHGEGQSPNKQDALENIERLKSMIKEMRDKARGLVEGELKLQ